MKKILCISLENLGDVLVSLPALSAIKSSIPNLEVHFLTKSSHQQLESIVSQVDQWHYFKDNIFATASSLCKVKFDEIIDFSNSFQSKAICFCLFHKRKAINPFDFPIKTNDQLIKFEEESINEFSLPSKYSVFALGARRVVRVISYPKMIELVDRWEGILVLIGDEWDKNFGDRLEILFPEKVINLCKKTTLEQSAAIINKAEKVITHNSAMLHLSVLLGKQLVVLYTNTAPTDGFLLKGAQIKPIELLGLTCKPCQKIETDVCPLFHFDCGTKLDLDPIFE